MQHITDQISMGEVSDIINNGIEITHVKVTTDFKCINVFWIHNNTNVSSLVTEEELQRCAKIIRHELSQLRVIGVVPPIQFVKNKQYFIEKEVEEKLAIIACEKDIEESSLYPEEIQLATSCISTCNQTLQEELVSNNDSKIDEPRIQLPVMRHDVLGLNHHKIMSRVIYYFLNISSAKIHLFVLIFVCLKKMKKIRVALRRIFRMKSSAFSCFANI